MVNKRQLIFSCVHKHEDIKADFVIFIALDGENCDTELFLTSSGGSFRHLSQRMFGIIWRQYFKIILFIYLFLATSSLSWGPGASLQLWHVSLAATLHMGSWFHDQGSNSSPALEGGFLTSRPLGRSLWKHFWFSKLCKCSCIQWVQPRDAA